MPDTRVRKNIIEGFHNNAWVKDFFFFELEYFSINQKLAGNQQLPTSLQKEGKIVPKT